MASIITEALAGHRTVHEVLYADYYSCSCGHRGKEQPSAHQARAVLAAIREAGAVEWGIEVWSETIAVDSEHEARLQVDMQRASHIASRIAFPWERAE